MRQPNPMALAPGEFIGMIERDLTSFTPSVLKGLVKRSRAWLEVSYDGEPPDSLTERQQQLEERCARH